MFIYNICLYNNIVPYIYYIALNSCRRMNVNSNFNNNIYFIISLNTSLFINIKFLKHLIYAIFIYNMFLVERIDFKDKVNPPAKNFITHIHKNKLTDIVIRIKLFFFNNWHLILFNIFIYYVKKHAHTPFLESHQ